MNRISRKSPVIPAGIVHLGLGAFSRAHIAIYTEDSMVNAGGDWGIVGVSLKSHSSRDALVGQQSVYNAVQLDRGETLCRQIEVINDVLFAPENPGAVLQQMAQPAIKIVSLTVTEKGYCLDQSTGGLDLQHPDIEHDLSNAIPVSAPGFLVRALQNRWRAGEPPFTVLSCDNLPQNGQLIKRIVLELAELISIDLMSWIEQNGRFPSTMVDRITPATTIADINTVANLIGGYDAAPVVHESFSQWVIEDDFVHGERPDWPSAGAQMTVNVQPFELMKLRMLNGTHSALAYLGYLAGYETIADTVAVDDFRAFTQALWHREIIPSLTAPSGISLPDYAANLMRRYENPSIRHLTWQIAADGSQKLPQRMLHTVHDRHVAFAQTPGLMLAIAAWMRYVGGIDEAGGSIAVRDPLAERFAALAKNTFSPQDWVAQVLAIREIFSESDAQVLSEPVTQLYIELLQHGALKLVGEYVQV